MRSEVFLVLFVHKKNSTLLLLKNDCGLGRGKARETKVKKTVPAGCQREQYLKSGRVRKISDTTAFIRIFVNL
jgi:hypothetical protein